MVTSIFSWLNEFFRSNTIPWKGVITGALVGKAVWELTLNGLNYRVQLKKNPSKEITETLKVSKEEYKKTQEYTKSRLLFSSFTHLYDLATDLLFLKYNVVAKLFYFFRPLVAAYLPAKLAGNTSVAVVAFIALSILGNIRKFPLRYYQNFVIEERFGFNKMTLGTFIKDELKMTFISVTFMSVFLTGASKIVEKTGSNYILYISAFILGLSTVMQVIFPTLIIPWFYKIQPLEKSELRTKVEALAKEHGFPSDKIYVMDGGSRSSHSNAFFVGLPWLKEIVLFDTLIADHTEDEIISVLAHELGHWKLNHIPILMLTEVGTTAFEFMPLALFLNNAHYFKSIGFQSGDMPTLVAVMTYSDACSFASVIVNFIGNLIVRTCEYAADGFAVKNGHGKALIDGLVTLDKKNMLAPEEDKLYTTYHHNHPTTLDRIQAIDLAMGKLK